MAVRIKPARQQHIRAALDRTRAMGFRYVRLMVRRGVYAIAEAGCMGLEALQVARSPMELVGPSVLPAARALGWV